MIRIILIQSSNVYSCLFIYLLNCLAITTICLAKTTTPINRNLWSYSFVTVSGTILLAIFTIFYILIDHFNIWPYGHPLHYPGMNPILLYFGHLFTRNVFPFVWIDNQNQRSHIWPLIQLLIGILMWLLISIYLAKKKLILEL